MAGLLRQGQERRLEGVLRVLFVPQHPPADAADHRPVAVDEQLERGLVPPGDEAGEQGGVGGAVRRRQPADETADDGGQRLHGHSELGTTPDMIPRAGTCFDLFYRNCERK